MGWNKENRARWIKNHPGFSKSATDAEYYRSHVSQKREVVRRNLLEWLEMLHQLGFDVCAKCLSTKRIHLHHVDPSQKKFNISNFSHNHAFNAHNILILKLELEKCIPLCCSCHRSIR